MVWLIVVLFVVYQIISNDKSNRAGMAVMAAMAATSPLFSKEANCCKPHGCDDGCDGKSIVELAKNMKLYAYLPTCNS